MLKIVLFSSGVPYAAVLLLAMFSVWQISGCARLGDTLLGGVLLLTSVDSSYLRGWFSGCEKILYVAIARSSRLTGSVKNRIGILAISWCCP